MSTGTEDLGARNQAEAGVPSLPDDAIIILAVRETVLFPGMVLPLTVGRARSIAAVQAAMRAEKPIGLLLQRDATVADPGPDGLYHVGTVAGVLRYVTGEEGAHHLVCQGQVRFRVVEFLEGLPYLAARIERLEDTFGLTPEIEARLHRLKEDAAEGLRLVPQVPQDLIAALQSIASPAVLADAVAGYLDISASEKQEVLETTDIQARLDKVLAVLAKRLAVLRLSHEIGEQTKESLQGQQREALLREQMRTIQRQLGEGEGRGAEIEDLRRAIAEAKMPPEAEDQAKKELARLERMPEAAAEYSMVRTYLDWLIELPWSKLSEDVIDLALARKVLD